MRTGDARLSGSVVLEQDQVVLALHGELDTGTQQTFRPLLDAARAMTGEAGTLLIDLTSLESFDRAGAAVLTDLAERVQEGRGEVRVRGAAPGLYDLLEATQLADTVLVERPTVGPALMRGLTTVAGSAATSELLDTALALVVAMAQTVIVGADGVSITLPRHGRYSTVAASNEVVLAMDHDQYETGQGPCLDAARNGQRFAVESLAAEGRWADFVPLARAHGIESILSSPLFEAREPSGALNMYSRTAGAFAIHERQWAKQFATEASALLTTAERLAPSTELAAQVTEALRSRQVIAQAQGIVMHRDSLDPDAAYARLRETSRATGQPLLSVCAALCEPPGSADAETLTGDDRFAGTGHP